MIGYGEKTDSTSGERRSAKVVLKAKAGKVLTPLVSFAEYSRRSGGAEAANRAAYDAMTLLPDYEVVTGPNATDAQVCHGDSGGPLLATRAGKLRVIGVASYVLSTPAEPCAFGTVYAAFGPAANAMVQRASLSATTLAMRGRDSFVGAWHRLDQQRSRTTAGSRRNRNGTRGAFAAAMMRMGSAVIAVGCFISVACSSGSAPSESAPAGQSFESTPTGGSARSPSALPNVSSNAPQPGNGAARTCPAEAATTCAAAVHLGSAADFLAAVGRLTWQFVSLSHTGALTLGGDLVADVDLEIDASQLVTPSTCPTTPAAGKPYPRCHAPLFREYAFPLWNGSGRIAGVSCKVVGDRPLRKGDTCARIAIAKGATFRLRAVSEDMHPSAPTYWSFIEFERECSAPCEADETRCAASQTCFARGYASCAYCEGLSAAVCACRDACGTKADAAECEFDTSPDTGVAGMCQSGSCVSAR